MRVCAVIDISAPREAVWAAISDPSRYLHFMSGITRWEVEGERENGVGARFRTLMRVKSAEVGGLVEVVEWDEPSVGSSRVDLQACKLEYSIVSPK